MKILVFDTETTGLPKFRNISINETKKWPHVVQLSFMLYDMSHNMVIQEGNYIIRLPINVEIDPKAEAVHGISLAQCEKEGIPMYEAFHYFMNAVYSCDMLLAHNISFDKNIMMVEGKRLGFDNIFKGSDGSNIQEYCTMKSTVNFCRIQRVNEKTGNIYYKYPKMVELHKYLFDYEPKGLHDSMADILCCLRCYFMLNYQRDILYENRRIAQLWRDKCITDDVIKFD